MGSVATCIVSLLVKLLQFLLCLKLKIHVLITLSYDHVISMWKSRPNRAGIWGNFSNEDIATKHMV